MGCTCFASHMTLNLVFLSCLFHHLWQDMIEFSNHKIKADIAFVLWSFTSVFMSSCFDTDFECNLYSCHLHLAYSMSRVVLKFILSMARLILR